MTIAPVLLHRQGDVACVRRCQSMSRAQETRRVSSQALQPRLNCCTWNERCYCGGEMFGFFVEGGLPATESCASGQAASGTAWGKQQADSLGQAASGQPGAVPLVVSAQQSSNKAASASPRHEAFKSRLVIVTLNLCSTQPHARAHTPHTPRTHTHTGRGCILQPRLYL